MNNEFNLEDTARALMNFAKDKGLTEVYINENWSVSYEQNAQNKFDTQLARLLNGMRLFQKSSSSNDQIAAAYGLVTAKVAASMLRDFFDALDTDILHALRDFGGPKIPEGYQPPAHYGYQD